MYRYAIISNLEQEKPSHKMSELPLHVTLIGVFTSDRNYKYFKNLLSDRSLTHRSITTNVIGRANFGKDDAHLMVSELRKTKELTELHIALIGSIGNEIGTMNPNFLPETYRPHVTDQNNRCIEKGKQVLIDNITLVEIMSDTAFERIRISLT